MKLTFSQWSAALAAIESGNDPHAWGDEGLAAGRWQMHPAFVQQWIGHVIWRVRASWNDIFQAALLEFYDKAAARGVSDVDAAIGFHLHGQAVAATAEDRRQAARYAARFEAAAREMGFAL